MRREYFLLQKIGIVFCMTLKVLNSFHFVMQKISIYRFFFLLIPEVERKTKTAHYSLWTLRAEVEEKNEIVSRLPKKQTNDRFGDNYDLKLMNAENTVYIRQLNKY